MLLVVSESIGRTPSVIGLIREMSLTPNFFAGPNTLEKFLDGKARRIVLLAEKDVDDEHVGYLIDALRKVDFGVVVCADRTGLRDSERAAAADALDEHPNVQWTATDVDVSTLCAAARKCRRRMLKLGKDELENAIVRRELFLQYQPKVERNDDSEWLTREAEALIRWRHPKHGLLGPLEFLPEAEAFGLISTVSEFVLFETASQLVRWREQGLNLNGCINLASSQLSNTDLADKYRRIVEKHGLACSNFTFEVIEQDIASSDAPHLKTLSALRAQGFRVSLDDFGVAAATLGNFVELPVDEIKIHAAALSRAQQNLAAQHLLAAVTGLAHNLGISVCAEGVETRDTFDFLATIECDKMQGYLISEAVMPEIIRRVYRPGVVENVA